MADYPKIEEIVERVVGQVLESHVPHLREELVRRVLEEMPAVPATAGENGTSSQALLQSLVAIQKGTAQKEILKQLLEQTAPYCGRAALFIVKAGTIQGWQARGFDTDQIRNFILQGATDLVKRALENRDVASGFAAQMGDQFAATFDVTSEADCILLPLILKEKVAALLYADAGSGPGGVRDQAALELMVRATGQWLEVLALRKSPIPAAEAPAETALSAVEPAGETAAAGDYFYHELVRSLAQDDPSLLGKNYRR